MRFEEAYVGWDSGRLTQAEAASVLGVCERTFRRYLERYEASGLEGLIDRRLEQVSHKKAPVDEVLRLTDNYRRRHLGWSAKHFYAWYRKDGGSRSYTWVKSRLQEAELVPKAKARGAHRKRRERSPWPGLMIHQDGSSHEWVPGQRWDLIVTLDDATSEHYSMFFVGEEGTMSSLSGVQEVIASRGLFSSFYSDRGSHYWHTPEAGGKVDRKHLTQFGQALQRLGIEMIPAYSPEARGRSERMFRTHQDRLPRELALAGITDMVAANRYLTETYRPAFNAEFMQPAMEEGSAFVAWIGSPLEDILCERFERQVGPDNCVSFEGKKLQIPADRHRCHYVKAKVAVLRRTDGSLAIYHGPRKLAEYEPTGQLRPPELKAVA
ncbi:MAG TPA: ISNCY family transposase [Rhodocyclaceae bacterium]|nr:ISNCY family transposase [Rhodocyclaceae bacterium]HMV21885.1 ISNCY family transposase [Rhodocyclaceae bacterium]HMW78064.1 ISNCY family transposase [Rhodocyclaceae bacterium]HNL21857.1 ISNCY family transposase [Rhodocyclaceae bacterium]